ncbi:zinc finger protein [Holotrichia oblita]|uniref:Zinc finger protein n=1 Tax=Holotrichia oblita TaxID=644536 RepID=A0ACB9SGM9_HOLOL|nr:zinc finger protein [Holotrichia oblita]
METIHLYNLNSLCRICLSKTEKMLQLFDSSNGLYDILKVVVNIEFERNEAFPNYLCSDCEKKILICQELINQCKITDQLLQRCKPSGVKTTEIDPGLESIPITEVIEYVSHDDDSNDSTSFDEAKTRNQVINVRKPRLKLYPHEEVMQEVDILRKKISGIKKCVVCNLECGSFQALSVHMSFVHKEEKSRWCSTCDVLVDDLNKHLAIVHIEKENSCKFCKKTLSSPSHLVEHVMSHSENRPYKCDACDKKYVSMRHLRVHARTHTQKNCICNCCGSTFSDVHSLKMHLGKVHNYISCLKCKEIFENGHTFDQHNCIQVLTEDIAGNFDSNIHKQNFCTLCNKNVRSLSKHNRHFHEDSKNNNPPTPKLCTVCGKQFKNFTKLKVHMRMHTGDTPYSCRYCDKKMARRNHLVAHERTHTGEKPHVCPICNKAFSQTGILNTHMKLHTGRPEMCVICGKRFCRPAELKLHMRKHTGEKPFVCSYCGKSFIQKSNLVEHIRSHTNDRPYACHICEKSFSQRSSLKVHVQIHLGEKPFKCSECSYACRQSYRLTVHMRQHNKNASQLIKSQTCDYCNKKFLTDLGLRNHITKVHFN